MATQRAPNGGTAPKRMRPFFLPPTCLRRFPLLFQTFCWSDPLSAEASHVGNCTPTFWRCGAQSWTADRPLDTPPCIPLMMSSATCGCLARTISRQSAQLPQWAAFPKSHKHQLQHPQASTVTIHGDRHESPTVHKKCITIRIHLGPPGFGT